MGSKRKTTFAKLNREAKVRERRAMKGSRKEARQGEALEEVGPAVHQVEDLSHLDVAVVAGVEPDVPVKR